MFCEIIQIGSIRAIACSRGNRVKPCVYCGNPHEFLCDYPIGKRKSGKKIDCDVPMCADCTQKGISANVDFCKKHYPLAKAAYERKISRVTQDIVS